MIHNNKEEFIKILDRAVAQKGFLQSLLEKDYYITLILARINELSENLVFKGGTCMSKIYYNYYRLSEDLDFSMNMPYSVITRSVRRKTIQPLKDNIGKFAEQFGMKIDGMENPGRNESKQYIYYFIYQSVLRPVKARIKFEVGLRYNTLCEAVKHKINHIFLHPFTGEPLFNGGKVNCLSLKELIAEKLRAAATRIVIAPRDFYDIDFVIKSGFKLADTELQRLFQSKLKEDGYDTNIFKYRINLGRTEKEIRDMKSRIKEELFDVLTPGERNNFNIDSALGRINNALKGLK